MNIKDFYSVSKNMSAIESILRPTLALQKALEKESLASALISNNIAISGLSSHLIKTVEIANQGNKILNLSSNTALMQLAAISNFGAALRMEVAINKIIPPAISKLTTSVLAQYLAGANIKIYFNDAHLIGNELESPVIEGVLHEAENIYDHIEAEKRIDLTRLWKLIAELLNNKKLQKVSAAILTLFVIPILASLTFEEIKPFVFEEDKKAALVSNMDILNSDYPVKISNSPQSKTLDTIPAGTGIYILKKNRIWTYVSYVKHGAPKLGWIRLQ